MTRKNITYSYDCNSEIKNTDVGYFFNNVWFLEFSKKAVNLAV